MPILLACAALRSACAVPVGACGVPLVCQDSDFGPSDADLMSKISGSKPQGGADVDLMALVDGPTPGGAPGLDSQSGALVAINPNKPFFRPS